MSQSTSALLIDGRFVAVFPRLVRALEGDVTAAAVLQAIHYRMQGRGSNSDQWITLSLADIAEEIGLSTSQAQRATVRLRDGGLLVSRESRGSSLTWTIDYAEVAALGRTDTDPHYCEPIRIRTTTDTDSYRTDTDSHHHRYEIASHTSYTEELEEPKKSKKADRFDEFWSVYPRRAAKTAARKAWIKAISSTPAQVIIDGAERYRDDPNRDDQFTAHPASWLNAGRWDDDPLPERSSGKVSGARMYAELAMEARTSGLQWEPLAQIGSRS